MDIDDSDLSASSTPRRKSYYTDRNTEMSDSAVIPPSEADTSDCSSEDIAMTPPVGARKISKPVKNNLLRKSLGYKSAIEDNSDESEYLSFVSVADSPLERNRGNELSKESDVLNKLEVSPICEENISLVNDDDDSMDSVFHLKKTHMKQNNMLSDDSSVFRRSVQPDDSGSVYSTKSNESDNESANSIASNEDGDSVHSNELIEDDESVNSTELIEDGASVHSTEMNEDKESVHSNELNEDGESVHSTELFEDGASVHSTEMNEDRESVHSIELNEDGESVHSTESIEDGASVHSTEMNEDRESVHSNELNEDGESVYSTELKEDNVSAHLTDSNNSPSHLKFSISASEGPEIDFGLNITAPAAELIVCSGYSTKKMLDKNGAKSIPSNGIFHDENNTSLVSSKDLDDAISDGGQVEENAFYGSPRRSNVIDLTQSDSSLQNSPAGATRQAGQIQRDVATIVAELSAVKNDIMVKETLLGSINIATLPDNGRNLKLKVSELKMEQSALERELNENDEHAKQKAALAQMRSNLEKKMFSSQSTLQPYLKTEEEEQESIGSSSKQSLNSKPNWGDLPDPDMTISGFGKRAMETHLAEKALTLEALSSLHNALKACPSEDTLAEDPKHLKVNLLPHQKHGLAWMLWREQERPSGGILADDMGLGKTLSMISLVLKDRENKEQSDNDSDSDDDSPKWMSSKYSRMPSGGTLVVCPASLVAQWEREILKRVKRRAISVDLYHGPRRETKPRRLAQYDVIVTTYNLVSRESGVETAKNATKMKDKGPLFMVKWNRVILDEAHVVRNHKSQMALGVCELVAKHRWCLTGTPIQNKELDLYALLKFLQCSPFDDITVWKKWVDNKNAAGMARLNTMMKSLMLRRTKQQLQERGDLNCLPEKSYERIDVHLDPEEWELYEKVALFSSTLFAEYLVQRAGKQQVLDARYGMSTKPIWEQEEGPDNQYTTTKELAAMHQKMKGVAPIQTHQILVLLLRLRQICCHPGLVKKMVEDGDLDFNQGGIEDKSGLDIDLFNKMNNLNIDESQLGDEEENDLLNKSGTFTVDSPVLSYDRPSAKIRAILDLIEERFLDSDDKIIIVSQWTSVLNIIAKFLKQMRLRFDLLTGEVPVEKRQAIVESINQHGSGIQILLLSLTAGGVGLNLVGANHLMLVDIHWNPQLEAQACDRIYRVGQKKNVFIYRFITVNTIEEKIKAIQDSKLAMAESVLTGARFTDTSKLTLADLQSLFSVPKPTTQQPGVPLE